MPSLHQSTDFTKKIGLWAILIIIGILILVFTFRTGRAIKNYFIPPGPPPVTVGFGKLPAIKFPKNITEETLQFELDNVSGVLPSFPTQLKVYKVLHNEPNLLNFLRTKEKVAKVGFVGSGQKEAVDEYKWTDNTVLGRTIKINTTTQNFTMNSFYQTYPPVQSSKNLTDEAGALEIARNFLESMDLLPEDIDLSKSTPQLYSLSKGVLTPASSFSNTQIIRVDFYQKDRDSIPMYYKNPPESSINFLIGGGEGSSDINYVVDAKFFYQKIDESGQTYPVKSSEKAFNELKESKGYIASYFGSNRRVKITDITLGYFFSDETQDFLMPIIVFQGEGQFYAYVSAVDEKWIK